MRYFIYCRKSTDTEDKQVQSLQSQENELMRLAENQQLEVVAVLKESRSAKEPGRPVFNEMIRRILKGEADAILCWKIDRLTRNPVDGGQIQWLLQEEKIKCITTFEKSYYPSDNVLVMSIEQAMAHQYIRDLSTNVKRGNRTKLEKGEWPAPAPFGYRKINKKVTIDSLRAPYVRRMFELYSTGEHSLLQLANLLYQEGLRTKAGKKLFRSTLHHMLNNKFYLGLMERQGKVYRGNHKPLVSEALFQKVQDILNGKNRPKHEKHFYSARGFLSCASCGCMLTGDTKKGHKYYYCTNGKGICQEHKRYLRSEKIDAILSTLFQNLKIDEQLIEISGKAFLERMHNDPAEYYNLNACNSLENDLRNLDSNESRLTDVLASGSLRKDLYEQKMKEIANRRVELENQLTHMGLKGGEPDVTFEQVKEVFLEANKAANGYLNLSPEEKRHTLGKLLSNLSIQNQEMAQWQFKSPYDAIARASKNATFSSVCAGLDSNQRRPKPTDLQSVVIDHSTTDACYLVVL